MGVSRPTFSRIYSRARQKVAKSFVEVREIIVEGGKVYYDSEWFKCDSCGCHFNNSDMFSKSVKCPLCGSLKTININSDEDSLNNKYNEKFKKIVK